MTLTMHEPHMDEEFEVLSRKSTKYLNDAVIVSRLAHWNIRGSDFYQTHTLFERVYNDLAGVMDAHVEVLRACGFNPTLDLFSGPGIEMDRFDELTLVELVLDYTMTLNSSFGMFFRFCEDNMHDPRLVGISDHLGASCSTFLRDQYLLQSRLGY